MSDCAIADPKYDFMLHGYIRSGILANADGNRADSVGLMPDGKWRLGNEEDTKIELIPTVTLTSDSGVVAKVQANITHQSKCTSDWNCQDDDGHDVQFREGFAELSNLDFAPEMTFWAGKRYSSSNTSSHQFDWEYIQYNGTGGGFDNMDLGFARFDAGVYAFSPTDETKAYPVDKGDQGYPDDYSLNLWLKKIGGTGFDLELIGHHMNRNEKHPTSAEKGYGVTGVYNFDGFYGLTGGYSRVVFQYGRGLAAGTRWVKTAGAGQTSTIPSPGAWCWITWPRSATGKSPRSPTIRKTKTTAGGRKTPKAGDAPAGWRGFARTSRSPKTSPCSTSWATNISTIKTTKAWTAKAKAA
jgi:sucrose porin